MVRLGLGLGLGLGCVGYILKLFQKIIENQALKLD